MQGEVGDLIDGLRDMSLAGFGPGWLIRAAGAALLVAVFPMLGEAAGLTDGLEVLWPGSALLLGLMLIADERPGAANAVLAGGIVGAGVFHAWLGLSAPDVLLCVLNNCLTAFIAYRLMRRQGQVSPLDGARGLWALVAACAVAALLPAAITAIGASTQGDRLVATLFSYAASLLSLLLLTPMVVIAARLRHARVRARLARRGLFGVVLPLAGLGAIAWLAFAQETVPITFLVAPAMLLVVFRLRAIGAAAGVCIVAVIATLATGAGHGPFAHAVLPQIERMLLLELFLACAFLSALPVAALLAEQERRAAESHALAERFRTVVENVADVIFQIDGRGCWTYLNPAWERLTGQTHAATLGQPWTQALSTPDQEPAPAWAQPVLAGTVATATQTLRIDTTGGPRWVEVFLRAMIDADGAPAGATGTMRDVDEAKHREERVTLAHHQAEERARQAALLASVDELTGVANRRAFLHKLEREIAVSIEFGWPLSVAMVDIDHFKQVNDGHGHQVGDAVLRQVARRAAQVVRGGDMVGRLGGEEFAILMPGATAADAAQVAERLRQAIEQPAGADPTLPPVTISIGLAERIERRSAERLLAVADGALYRAKEDGRNRVCVAA